MTKEELKDYLVCEAGYSDAEVESMTAFDLVDAYLTWEGIIGYTETIVDVVRHAFGDMSDEEFIEDILYNN